MTISGTQNKISCPSMYFTVTTTTMALPGKTSPKRIPAAIPSRSLNGKLLKMFILFLLL